MKQSVSLKSLLRLDKIQGIYFSHSLARSAFQIVHSNLSRAGTRILSKIPARSSCQFPFHVTSTTSSATIYTFTESSCYHSSHAGNLSSCTTYFQLHLEVFGQPWHTCSISHTPDCFSATGEAPLMSWAPGAPVRPSAVQPTTVMPPSRLSVSAELLLVILPHREDLSTWLESASWEPSSPAG